MHIQIGSFHTHTRYSDGVNTPEEMVLAAIDKGLPAIGFSDHAPAEYDFVAMASQNLPRYRREIEALKQKYGSKVEIYTGLEYDALAPWAGSQSLDYTIGAVHYIRHLQTGERYCIDSTPEKLCCAIEAVGDGSPQAMLERYYDTVIDMIRFQRPSIVGHLDLPVKLNGEGRFFDESSPWYRQLEQKTAKRLAAFKPLIELNTGGMARGYRQTPYPSRHFLELLFRYGIPVILSADAHKGEELSFGFGEALALLQEVGYTSVKTLSHGRFVDLSMV